MVMSFRDWFFRGEASSRDEWDDAIDAWERRQGRPPGPDRLLRRGDPEVHHERRLFLQSRPWPELRARIEQKAVISDTRSRLNLTLWFSGLGLATSVAVVALLVLAPREAAIHGSAPAGERPSAIRTKGGGAPSPIDEAAPPRLFISTDGEEIRPGASVRSGIEVFFTVNTGSYDHVLVFGVESDGVLTPYYPEEEDGESLLLGRGRGLRLPDSVRLDDRTGPERFVAVFSRRPLRWGDVRRAAEAAFLRCEGRLREMGPLATLDEPRQGELMQDTQEAAVWFEKVP